MRRRPAARPPPPNRRAPGGAAGFVADPQGGIGEARLNLVGDLDLATAPLFLGALAAVLHRRPALLVLDLRRLTFIDARCAGAIATAASRMGEWGGTLAAREPQRIVRRALELCGSGDLLVPHEAVAIAWRGRARRGAGSSPSRPARAPVLAEAVA